MAEHETEPRTGPASTTGSRPEREDHDGSEPGRSSGTGGPGGPSEGGTYRSLDPRSLRGLAHPLRIRLLRSLRHDGPATASQLAEKLGESSGATSYHLRQLAAHSFVEDDSSRGKGRERWWKASQEGTSVDHSLWLDPDPAVRGAADLFVHEVATMHTEEVGTWLGTAHEWPDAWRLSSDLSDFTLRLTPAQALELNNRVHELIGSYRAGEPPSPDAAMVRIHLHSFPRRTSREDDE
ncbi:helix-turn-helix domain-containing protein [Streptomyces sp. NPDC051018]|uniref:helix-turn-helix domain-containing protein n=1 Tax=Streptomyces sp. NPDC051018 TaxID=3365639 RepID=UPI0037A3AF50